MFRAVKLTKHVDVDFYKYSGHGVGIDRKGSYSIGNKIGRNVIIFEVDMSLSPHIDNKKKDILILGKGPTQGLEHTLTVKKLFSINFTKEKIKFYLSLHYNGADSCLLMVQRLLNKKQKILELLHMNCT